MKTNILTLFPDMFPGTLGQSLAGQALSKGLWEMNITNIRDFGEGVHKNVDDTPFGGGAGMVLRPDILSKAIESVPEQNRGRIIYLSPRGKPLTQSLTQELSAEPKLTLLCGRYEGVDERILEAYDIEEISVGDYILSGGEIAAQILLDACIRLLPGVIGNKDTHGEESFTNGLLEYPHYTKPAKWLDNLGKMRHVPDVLTSGHHAKIKQWRLEQSETLTKQRRTDLWAAYLNRNKNNKSA